MRNLIVIFLFSFFPVSSFSFNLEDKLNGVVAIFGEESAGSGVLISRDGFILSNWHVVEGQEEISILILQDEEEENFRTAKIIKSNKLKDLVLLKLKDSPKNLNFIKLSLKVPEIGDEVHAIGHPEGELWSYSKGYISAHRRNYLAEFGENLNSQEEKISGTFSGNVYQTQTPIFPGNSGGPLLNKDGNLIGINTFTNLESSLMSYSITNEEILKFLIN